MRGCVRNVHISQAHEGQQKSSPLFLHAGLVEMPTFTSHCGVPSPASFATRRLLFVLLLLLHRVRFFFFSFCCHLKDFEKNQSLQSRRLSRRSHLWTFSPSDSVLFTLQWPERHNLEAAVTTRQSVLVVTQREQINKQTKKLAIDH